MGIRQRRTTPTARHSLPNSRGQRWDSPGMFCLSKQMLAFVHVDFSFFSELFQRIQHFRSAQKFLDIMTCLERMLYFRVLPVFSFLKGDILFPTSHMLNGKIKITPCCFILFLTWSTRSNHIFKMKRSEVYSLLRKCNLVF